CPSRLRLGPLSTAIRIQRFRFCSQDWNWSRSSVPGSVLPWGNGSEPPAGEPKKSSNETAASFSCPAAGTAGGMGTVSPPNTELSERASWAGLVDAPGSEAAEPGEAAGGPEFPGGRAASRASKKEATD